MQFIFDGDNMIALFVAELRHSQGSYHSRPFRWCSNTIGSCLIRSIPEYCRASTRSHLDLLFRNRDCHPTAATRRPATIRYSEAWSDLQLFFCIFSNSSARAILRKKAVVAVFIFRFGAGLGLPLILACWQQAAEETGRFRSSLPRRSQPMTLLPNIPLGLRPTCSLINNNWPAVLKFIFIFHICVRCTAGWHYALYTRLLMLVINILMLAAIIN